MIKSLIYILLFLLYGLDVVSQEISYKAYLDNQNLSEYYKSRIDEKWYNEPWHIYSQKFNNNLTERIDKVHFPKGLPWINTAWAVMEMKTGMIPENNIYKVTKALIEFWKNPSSEYSDLYGIQSYVSEKYGVEVGGDLMMARTRPPQRQQFAVRKDLMKTICLLHDFQQILLETANRFKKAVMPGYTHIRHAQPTTLGHYLMSIYDAVDRSMKTVEDGYHAMSLNELGCGALAGTSWNLDRALVSEYLGLEGLVENTNDAVSYSDGYVLLVSGLTNIMVIISRMGLEMEFWSGLEYDFLDFEIGAGSYMMPNKRSNQTYLENTTVGVAQIQGNLMEVVSMGARIPNGDMQPMAYNMQKSVLDAIGVINKHVMPFLYHFPTIKVHEQRMLEVARKGYSCATELSNEIVRRFGVDYRTAHDIVHEFVLTSTERGIASKNASIGEFDGATNKVIGKKLQLSQKELREILDPVHFVNVTNSQGGVAPSEVSRMIVDRWNKLDAARKRHEKRIMKLEVGKEKMLTDLKKLFENYK